MMDDWTELIDKKMILEKEIQREAEIFKTAINELVKAFEKDTGVYIETLVPGHCMGSIEVEIDFEKTLCISGNSNSFSDNCSCSLSLLYRRIKNNG